jgi:hypothetical protein
MQSALAHRRNSQRCTATARLTGFWFHSQIPAAATPGTTYTSSWTEPPRSLVHLSSCLITQLLEVFRPAE